MGKTRVGIDGAPVRGWHRRAGGMGAVALLAATLALAVTGSTPASADPGVVTGTVFRDFNSDGFMNTSATVALPAIDVGMGGVTVRAFDSTGAQVATATTAANGTYTLNYTTGDATTERPHRVRRPGRLPVRPPRLRLRRPVGHLGAVPHDRPDRQLRRPPDRRRVLPGESRRGHPRRPRPLAQRAASAPSSRERRERSTRPTTPPPATPAIGTGANDLRLQATRAQTGTIWGTGPLRR